MVSLDGTPKQRRCLLGLLLGGPSLHHDRSLQPFPDMMGMTAIGTQRPPASLSICLSLA